MLIDGRVLAPLWVIRDAYRRSHPTGDTLLATNDSVAALVEAVRSLALLPPQQYGTHPLCDFLCGVAQQSEGERARLLLGCAVRISPEALAQKPGGGMVATEPARPDLPPLPPPPSARVVVRFEPGRMDPSEQVVTAWLCAGDAPRRLALEQTTWTSADRASRLAELRAEILSNVADPAATLIEFVVPRTLVSQEFDQWEMSSPELGYIGRLVDDLPLDVRPLERSRNALARSRLEARWKAIRAHLGAPCHVRDVGQVIGQDSPQALWIADHRCGDLLFQVLGVDQRVACAVLRRAPQGQFSEKGMDVFKALLLRGVPIMLWPRRTPRSTALDQQLLELVNGQRLATLPDIVHEQRRGTRSAPLGAHLTLIWDDPTRPIPEPEVVPLLSPAMG